MSWTPEEAVRYSDIHGGQAVLYIEYWICFPLDIFLLIMTFALLYLSVYALLLMFIITTFTLSALHVTLACTLFYALYDICTLFYALYETCTLLYALYEICAIDVAIGFCVLDNIWDIRTFTGW